jgi:hypothetical protein
MSLPQNGTAALSSELAAKEAAESEGEAALHVCRKLRTKLAFLPLRTADNDPLYWQRGDGSTSVYWCLRTMECAGPDGGLAHATLCGPDRLCCEPITS